MERKILLEKNRSRFSVNKPNKIWTELERSAKPMQDGGIMGNFSLFEQYNIERDNCNKYRMIFVVNPICSNVLFNMKTEIVQNEGDENPVVLKDNENVGREGNTINTSPLNRTQAIKDTEYSHPDNGNYVYHCGVDIFNNHMLRNNGFVHVGKIGADSDDYKGVYNTISDVIRDGNGQTVKRVTDPNQFFNRNHKGQIIRAYGLDNTLSLRRAYQARIKEKDGWIGFYNPSNLNVYDPKGGVLINAMLLNRKPCEFVDLYPDRTLYSFIPKYNEYRKRGEKNWDYCITYPYKKDYKKVDEICGGHEGAIKADFTRGHNASSVSILMCRSSFRHTLKFNDKISLYYYSNEEWKKYPLPLTIVSVGNYDGSDTDRFFSIRANDISEIYDDIGDEEGNGAFYFKKISNGNECEYYFRIYKKLTKPDGSEIRSDINKLAYAENIYGDRMAQVMFLDDIDIDGLCDHLGRPLTELYFTIVKRNAGHEEWRDGNYGDNAVEFSHCFGEVTSGLDFGPFSASSFDYNIRYLHNVKKTTTFPFAYFGETIGRGRPKTIESDITIDFDEFYGDLVEFDTYNYSEKEISPVLHRFNTLQRENISDEFKRIYYDRIVRDSYDVMSDTEGGKGFRISTEIFNTTTNAAGQAVVVNANIRPEGYFYNPHTKIKVREEDDLPVKVRGKYINFASAKRNGGGLSIEAPTDYGFLKWDYIIFTTDGWMDGNVYHEPKVVFGKIEKVEGRNLTITFDDGVDVISNLTSGGPKRYKAYYCMESVPSYAKFSRSTREFTWKGLKAPSEMRRDMELYDTTFANGRFYIEKNITFFLRRQDPTGDFGLSYGKNMGRKTNPMEFFNVDPTILDLSQIFNFYNNIDNICY